MSAAREKDQADFDLERFVDMFDEALTSRDPRVMDALRGLMMMVTLTRPESRDSGLHDRNPGPLRRMYEDMSQLHRRIERVEELYRQSEHSQRQVEPYNYPYEKYTRVSAQNMAQTIDQELLNKLKSSYMTKIQGLK
jgi:hypothetical protein